MSKLKYGYARRFVSEELPSGNGLHPALCYGRQNHSYEEPILNFFRTRTKEELKQINQEAEKRGKDELLVIFSAKIDNKDSRLNESQLDRIDMRTVCFYIQDEDVSSCSWDELRDVPQHEIVFNLMLR